MSNYVYVMVKTIKTLKLQISDSIRVYNIWTEHRHHWLDANLLLHIPLAEKDMFGIVWPNVETLMNAMCRIIFESFSPAKYSI